MLNFLLAKNFTFDGVTFFDNSIKFTLFGTEFEIAYYAIAILSGMIMCVLLAIPMMKKQGLEPDILLLDEPFSALDFQTRIDICDDVYKMIKDQNICAIFVTHDISEAISMCDRVVLLSNRPTVIKKEYNLGNVFKDINTPFERRTHPLFNRYFNEIWAELRNNE